MKFSDILKNEHFNNLAAIVRVSHTSDGWRKSHPEVAFWQLLDGIGDVKTETHFARNRQEFLNRFCELLTAITGADSGLSYTEDDLAWFIAQMDGENALAVASLFFAWASAPDTMLTAEEVGKATGTAGSGWRNKAAAGEIPGAVKKAKTWLLPRSVLRSRGINV